MAKFVPDATLDSMLGIISAANKVIICSTQPTTYTEANSTYSLGSATSPSFSAADGDTSGRKITMAQKTGVSITSSGTAAHIALVNTGTTTLLAVTTCTSQAVTSGNTATINAFKYELGDVT